MPQPAKPDSPPRRNLLAQIRFPFLGVLVVGVLALVIFWSWDWFIPMVERRAGAALGRKVTLAHLHVHVGRVIRITADEVKIDEPEGFATLPPFATADHLMVGVRLWPLLGGKLDLPVIALDKPVVELNEKRDGTANYQFPASGGGGSTAMPRIGELNIDAGQLHLVHAGLRSNMRAEVHTTPGQGDVQPRIVADVRGTYTGQAIIGHFSGGALVSLADRTRPYPVDVDVRHGPTRLTLVGTVDDPLSFAGTRLRLTLAGPDMSLLYPLTGVVIPQTPAYHVAGSLDYHDGRVRFRNFEGVVGSSDLGGTLDVDPHQSVTFVDTNLHSRHVDLADLGGFFGATPGEHPSTTQQAAQEKVHQASGAVLPSTPINMPRLKATNVHLAYHGDHIENRHTPLDNIDVLADIRDGTIDVHHLNFAVGKGTLASSGTFVPQGNGMDARIRIDMEQIDLARLMQAMGHNLHGQGIIGGHIVVHGHGQSLAQIVGNGDGGITMALDDGGDISAILPDLLGLELGKALLSALGLPARTDLKCLIADMPLQDGVFHTRTMLLETGDTRTVGSGDIRFSNNTIDYKLLTHSRHFAIASFPGPLYITGPLKSPNVRPGAEIIGRAVASVLTGFVFSPVGLLPTIEGGVGKNSSCASAIREVNDNPAAGIAPHASHPGRHGAHGHGVSARQGAAASKAGASNIGPNGLSAAERARIRAVWAGKMATH
ncbi:AsmA family protein [Komagataeibacter medellinensis]|uniref:Lipopolysaccharide biogenesis periplasmic protein n=1 Tax=Komagataeibacter medellinensis (strain NBRC 3288 / BCRC 11682 / LMG 1693 / Kondo 51) TaxID=634177 RepID=G2I0S0_KOMMN|nr:AsmA family protein [Komagataeibacter medellinensis]BAK84528.1 lipopolysaccharide biogenesis periplasmic protein [Komagataeibacter medellinensis NBRC 3288]